MFSIYLNSTYIHEETVSFWHRWKPTSRWRKYFLFDGHLKKKWCIQNLTSSPPPPPPLPQNYYLWWVKTRDLKPGWFQLRWSRPSCHTMVMLVCFLWFPVIRIHVWVISWLEANKPSPSTRHHPLNVTSSMGYLKGLCWVGSCSRVTPSRLEPLRASLGCHNTCMQTTHS